MGFRVTAALVRGTKLTVRVEGLDDEELVPPANESFALMLLREKGDSGPLAKAVSRDDLVDEKWQEDWAHGFVSDVAASEIVPGAKPKATLEITVTHEGWIAHVAKGDVWSSNARVIVSECDVCDPIVPAVSEDTLLTGPIVALDKVVEEEIEDGFLYLPRLAWGPSLTEGPPILEVPAYAPSSYGVIDRIAKPRSIPKEWLGRAVRVEAWSQPEDGALLVGDPTNAKWATMSATAYGTGEGKVDAIGLLALKSGRRGTKLTYGKALARVRAQRLEMTILRRVHLDVRFRLPPGPFALGIADVGEVIDFLASGLDDKSTAPLRRALATDVVPDHYVMKWAIDADPIVDLDVLPLERAKAVIAGEWPIVTLRVMVTDGRWLEHLIEHPPVESIKTQPLPAPGV